MAKAGPLGVRARAAKAVMAVVDQGRSLSAVLPPLAEELSTQDAALLQELSAGSLRWYLFLEPCLTPLLAKPLKRKDRDIHGLLIVGAYQLLFTDKPDYAALSSTVEGCQQLKKVWAKKLVNGVLRQLQRRQQELVAQLTPNQRQAHPDWLADKLTAAWGELAETVMTANNQRPPMCLRVNQRKTHRDDYLALLQQQQIDAHATAHSPVGIRLPRGLHPSQLPGFEQGSCSVQDEAAQLCAALLDPKPQQRVLDACAAPGGKTCHLLEYQPALRELVALDVDAERLQRVQQNLDRLQLHATLQAADAGELKSWWDGQHFDAILLDAPCSGTGVIRRHPDIKLLRKQADIAKLAAIQQQLLQQLWQVLTPGGRLLYTTCSVLPEENAEQISSFISQQPDARHLPIHGAWGREVAYGRQLLPQTDGPDGFFYALLEKTQ